ncbi:hypothetical protein Btru_037417, partial [Bulinus truncatus]
IVLYATLEKADSFVAIDDIETVDCDSEPREEVTCPGDRPFHCYGSDVCLSRDQVCDRHEDCLCREDEQNMMCDNIPPKGLLNLDTCDFPSGQCLWYNVRSRTSGDFRWEKVVDSITSQTFNRLHPLRSNSSLTQFEIKRDESYLHVKLNGKWKLNEAILRSVSFEPNYESQHCQIRFWYLIDDDDPRSAVLKLELIQLKRFNKIKPILLWESPSVNQAGFHRGVFQRAVVSLPVKLTNVSFMLQFKTYFTNADTYGQVALHQLTMSPECFHTVLSLSTCGQMGRQGPTQEMCDHHYDLQSSVRVSEDGNFAGAQIWTVPKSSIYRFEVFGSRGGMAVDDQKQHKDILGTLVETKLYFEKGESIFFAVGQQGDDACPVSVDVDTRLPPYCTVSSANGWHRGGAGGGGATIVFKMLNDSRPLALIVAGGGKGQRITEYVTEGETAQADGDPVTMTAWDTELLLNRSLDGHPPCHQMDDDGHEYWMPSGGFGLGGGTCGDRGLGGPTVAGASLSGKSFIHSSAGWFDITTGHHSEAGLVEVFVDSCHCSYHCMWLENEDVYQPTCLCPSNRTSTKGCQDIKKDSLDLTTNFMLMIIISGVVTVLLSLCCVGLYLRRQAVKARHPTSIKKIASFFCPCVHFYNTPVNIAGHTLSQIQRPPAVMHTNPNYDRIDLNNSDQGLKEIPRKYLKLARQVVAIITVDVVLVTV